MNAAKERGVALITVLVVLASMALLMTGVFTLVRESTESASTNTRYQEAKGVGKAAMGQVASLINQVAVPGFQPPAPPGYGVQWNRDDFGKYVRDEMTRSSATAGGAPDPCSQSDPDISYTVQTNQGTVDVVACVERISAGGLSGSGTGQVFARTSQGTANNESLFEVTVWASGGNGEVRAQRQATIRGYY